MRILLLLCAKDRNSICVACVTPNVGQNVTTMKSQIHPTPSPGSSTVAPLMTPKIPPANPAAASLARAAKYALTLTDRAICSADDKLARMKDFACAAKPQS